MEFYLCVFLLIHCLKIFYRSDELNDKFINHTNIDSLIHQISKVGIDSYATKTSVVRHHNARHRTTSPLNSQALEKQQNPR